MKSVTVGIATYNRKSILTKMAASFYLSNLSGAEVHVRVYDDCSSEFDGEFLKTLFPGAAVRVNKVNLKADLNTFGMYEDFLTTGDDYFFNADSDLIFRKDWLSFCLDHIEETQGVMSIFNTKNHPAVADSGNPEFVLKEHIGAAGTFFKRERVKEIVGSLSDSDRKMIDWSFSKYFTENGLKIFCSRESYVQHIGLAGQNSSLTAIDYADGFTVDSIENGQILNDLLHDFTENLPVKFKAAVTGSVYYKAGRVILAPFTLAKKMAKKLFPKAYNKLWYARNKK